MSKRFFPTDEDERNAILTGEYDPHENCCSVETLALAIMQRDELLNVIKEIKKVTIDYDTGEREYKMSDYEYIAKQCDKILKEFE